MAHTLRIRRDDFPEVPLSRRGRKLPGFLPKHESDKLVAWVVAEAERKLCPRWHHAAKVDVMLIHLGLYMGLRCFEMCDLLIENLDLTAQSALIVGKGSKDRYVPIPSKMLGLFADWIGSRGAGPLLYSSRSRQLNERSVYWRIVRAGKKAGLTKNLHPHLLRHSCATQLLQSGADIREVQEILGHASLATTQIYLHCCPNRLRAAVERLM